MPCRAGLMTLCLERLKVLRSHRLASRASSGAGSASGGWPEMQDLTSKREDPCKSQQYQVSDHWVKEIQIGS